jgi:hypothetical protein
MRTSKTRLTISLEEDIKKTLEQNKNLHAPVFEEFNKQVMAMHDEINKFVYWVSSVALNKS